MIPKIGDKTKIVLFGREIWSTVVKVDKKRAEVMVFLNGSMVKIPMAEILEVESEQQSTGE